MSVFPPPSNPPVRTLWSLGTLCQQRFLWPVRKLAVRKQTTRHRAELQWAHYCYGGDAAPEGLFRYRSIAFPQPELDKPSSDPRCYMSEKELLFRVARALSPDAPNAALARPLGYSKAAARAYTAGRRKPPLAAFGKWREELAERIRTCHALNEELKQAAWVRSQEPAQPLRGFFEIKERDGPGTPPRDARNRAGRPKRSLAGRT